MRYLSMDIEATGLDKECLMIELALLPFDTDTRIVEESLAFHTYVYCPPFEELKSSLNQWVVDHNEVLITTANTKGKKLPDLRQALLAYLESAAVRQYFSNDKITLFGKSMNAIDLPFLERDLGWDFMRRYFQHRQLDLSSVVHTFIDMGKLPPQTVSGSKLMKHLGMGSVAHTALEDARNTALMYFKMLDI